METFSALLALCVGNSPVPGEFPTQRPVTRSVDVFFDLRLNKRLSKQWWGWWFETLSRPLWRHRNENPIDIRLSAQYVINAICDETMKIGQMYIPCFDTNAGNHDILHSLLRDYVINKRYDTLFGDLIPLIAAKSIDVNIFVITKRGTGYYVHNVKNVHGPSKNVMILKNGDHYDAILKVDNISVIPSEHRIRSMDSVVNAPNPLGNMSSSSSSSDQAEKTNWSFGFGI